MISEHPRPFNGCQRFVVGGGPGCWWRLWRVAPTTNNLMWRKLTGDYPKRGKLYHLSYKNFPQISWKGTVDDYDMKRGCNKKTEAVVAIIEKVGWQLFCPLSGRHVVTWGRASIQLTLKGGKNATNHK